jgi:TM2 domain-containing membrane protein YozV
MDLNILWTLPGMEEEEFQFLQQLMVPMDDYRQQQFLAIYRSRRKDPQVLLLATLLGFVGIAGVQRFMINQIVMGILYFFTCGLFFIGTLVDLIRFRKLSWKFNREMAAQSAGIANSFTR